MTLRLQLIALIANGALAFAACGGSQPVEPTSGSTSGAEAEGTPVAEGSEAAGGEETAEPDGSRQFQLSGSDTAGQARGERPSEITPTATEAAMRLFVVDRDSNGPIPGIVIRMTAPDGTHYYTHETDSQGYAEVLVPIGQRYEMEYLSLGRRNTTASVEVPSRPRQNIRLTLRYRRVDEVPRAQPQAGPQRFVLDGVHFATNSATIQTESFPRLDRVVEYMTHRPSVRIRVAGHTDNVGNPRVNQTLSERRARAVRDYLVSRGIDGSRVEAVGYGDQQPVASNDSEEGRQQNRRIEAIEL